jgi:hypothetical protein
LAVSTDVAFADGANNFGISEALIYSDDKWYDLIGCLDLVKTFAVVISQCQFDCEDEVDRDTGLQYREDAEIFRQQKCVLGIFYSPLGKFIPRCFWHSQVLRSLSFAAIFDYLRQGLRQYYVADNFHAFGHSG